MCIRDSEARDPAVQGGEAQPQAHGRGRYRLRRHPDPTHAGRHPARDRGGTPRGRGGTGARQQVVDGQRRGGCRVCRRPHLRRGGAPGPRAPAHLGRARRREQPPDRSDRCRGSRAQGVGERRHRPYPRAGVPVEGGLVLPRRRRPRRRGMGAPPRLGLSSTGSPPGWPGRSGVPPRWPSSTAPNGPARMPAPPT